MKKPRIRYALEQKDKEVQKRTKQELVIAQITAGFVSSSGNERKYERVKYSLEATILPKDFGKQENNFNYDKPTFDKYSLSNRGIKNQMERLESNVGKLHSNYVINGQYPTAKEFKTALEIIMGRKEREKKFVPTVLEFLKAKIDTDLTNIDSSRKGEIKFNTIKTYKTLVSYIENYESATSSILTFDKLNESVYWNFWDVQDEILRGIITVSIDTRTKKQQIKKNGFLISSICKYQKTLIKLLRLAKKAGIEISLDLDNIDLVLEDKPNSKDIFINEADLSKIINSNVTGKELSQAKDYVILASLLGMRYESMEEGNDEPINIFKDEKYNFKYIHSSQNKTGTQVIIPLMKPVEDIIIKHQNQFPKFSSNQEINRWLKKLFLDLKINTLEKITYHTYKLGEITEHKPLNEIISTHDFKKTFYSNLTLMLVNESVIDNVTHPDRVKKNPMGKFYDRTKMLDKAKQFVDEIKRANTIKKSKIYTF